VERLPPTGTQWWKKAQNGVFPSLSGGSVFPFVPLSPLGCGTVVAQCTAASRRGRSWVTTRSSISEKKFWIMTNRGSPVSTPSEAEG